MFPKSTLGEFAALVPSDKRGMLPEPGNDWREMDWDLGEVDPCCDADTVELLDDVWWPRVIELVASVRAFAQERAGV